MRARTPSRAKVFCRFQSVPSIGFACMPCRLWFVCNGKKGCKNGKDCQYPHVQTTRPAASAQEPASGEESETAKDKKKERSRGRSSSRRNRSQTPPKGKATVIIPSALVAQCRGLRFDPTPTTVTLKVERGNILDPLRPIARKIGYRHNQDYPIDMTEKQARIRAKELARSLRTKTTDDIMKSCAPASAGPKESRRSHA